MSSIRDASWIWHPSLPAGKPQTVLFCLDVELRRPSGASFIVTADQRYQLFLDGARVGSGPERGDAGRWFYERYEIELSRGEHRLTALAWFLPEGAPGAQIGVAPGFLFAGSAGDVELTTGVAPWTVAPVGGITHRHDSHAMFCGPRYEIDGATFDYAVITGERAAPEAVAAVSRGGVTLHAEPANRYGIVGQRNLHEPMLAHALDVPFRAHVVRWASSHAISSPPERLTKQSETVADSTAADASLEERASRLLTTGETLTIDPRQEVVVILELDTYYCAYPELTTSGGAGARVELGWAESLYEHTPEGPRKGNRSDVEGKFFTGDFDAFLPGGRHNERFTTPWWRSGRYLLLRVVTGDDALELNDLSFRETRQPIEPACSFTSSDARLEEFFPIGFRSLQMCAHETLVDCPYYEQLQYVGDSRLDALVLYAAGSDDSIARKCILQFDESRLVTGITRASYPNRETQIISGFSLRWICMVADLARYREEPDFVRARLAGCRAVLDCFDAQLNADGLLPSTPYWDFVDWAVDWDTGVPPVGKDGASCIHQLEYAEALASAAALESYVGEETLAALYRSRRETLLVTTWDRYWDDERGLLSDTADGDRYSEHVQALAILAGLGSAADRRRMVEGLSRADDLSRCTIYYTWYLFEALFEAGRPDLVHDRLDHWFAHRDLGLLTCAETPEPSRSDCHAWGAHPIWHYFSSFAGIRPADWGFSRVRIAPQLGPLEHLCAQMPHPAGSVRVDLRRAGEEISCTVGLPPGVTGTFVWAGHERPLAAGTSRFLI